MSLITRTVPHDYNLSIEDRNELYSYNSVVTNCTLSSQNGNNTSWKVIPFPFIMSRIYKLDVSLQLKALSELIPHTLNQEDVKLTFFFGECQDTATCQMQHISLLEQNDYILNPKTKEMQVSFKFKIKEGFRTTKSHPQFVYIALNMNKIVLKYLVCDMAVFSNDKKVSPDGRLAIGRGTENILRNHKCFWFSAKMICTVAELKAAKQQQLDQPIHKRPLFIMLKATQDCAKNMDLLLKCNSSDLQEQFLAQAKGLIQALTEQVNATECITEIKERSNETICTNEIPPLGALPISLPCEGYIPPLFQSNLIDDEM